MKFSIILIFILVFNSNIFSQTYIKLNTPTTILGVPGLGVELPISKKLTFQLDVTTSFWNSVSNRYDKRPYIFNQIFPEVRYYFKELNDGSAAMDVAISISEGLARRVLAAEVDGEVWDLTRPIPTDSSLKLLSFSDEGGKSTMWHSSAHLMAEALEFYYPGIKLAIGPPIENGFYYDVDFGKHEFTDKDLAKVEKKMLFDYL